VKPKLSLKARGIQLLAQREHSRSELRAKLLRHARADALLAQQVAAAAPVPLAGTAATLDASGHGHDPGSDPEAIVEALLDWLESHHYLDETRFVESRLHARSGRYGNLRIRQELAQHGVVLSDNDAAALKNSELARARDVWSRKFGDVPADPAARAKQMRFLAGRGFSPEVIRRVVRGGEDD
jgi:regulatory protein